MSLAGLRPLSSASLCCSQGVGAKMSAGRFCWLRGLISKNGCAPASCKSSQACKSGPVHAAGGSGGSATGLPLHGCSCVRPGAGSLATRHVGWCATLSLWPPGFWQLSCRVLGFFWGAHPVALLSCRLNQPCSTLVPALLLFVHLLWCVLLHGRHLRLGQARMGRAAPVCWNACTPTPGKGCLACCSL
jgi:hypothetical protein